MVGISNKEICRFEVRVLKRFLWKVLVRRDFVIRDFCWPWQKKYPEKVISLIQTNINLYMFRAEFLAEEKTFLTSACLVQLKIFVQRSQNLINSLRAAKDLFQESQDSLRGATSQIFCFRSGCVKVTMDKCSQVIITPPPRINHSFSCFIKEGRIIKYPWSTL